MVCFVFFKHEDTVDSVCKCTTTFPAQCNMDMTLELSW